MTQNNQSARPTTHKNICFPHLEFQSQSRGHHEKYPNFASRRLSILSFYLRLRAANGLVFCRLIKPFHRLSIHAKNLRKTINRKNNVRTILKQESPLIPPNMDFSIQWADMLCRKTRNYRHTGLSHRILDTRLLQSGLAKTFVFQGQIIAQSF